MFIEHKVEVTQREIWKGEKCPQPEVGRIVPWGLSLHTYTLYAEIRLLIQVVHRQVQ
jgi:hypothetical protein